MDDEKYYGENDYLGNWLKNQRIKNVKNKIKGKLLDIACGENDLVKSYGNGKGIDINDYGADAVFENFYDLPFDDQSFDTITILSSINYFEQPERVLKEVYRLLKKDGVLVITNTNYAIMKVWHLFRESWAYKAGYTEKELVKMLKRNNFKIRDKEYFNLIVSYVLVLEKVT